MAWRGPVRLGAKPDYSGLDVWIYRSDDKIAALLCVPSIQCPHDTTECSLAGLDQVRAARAFLNFKPFLSLNFKTSRPANKEQKMSTTSNTVAIPADAHPRRNLVVANPDSSNAPHLGGSGGRHSYTILLSGMDTAGRLTLIGMGVSPSWRRPSPASS